MSKALNNNGSKYLLIPNDFWNALNLSDDSLFSCYLDGEKIVFMAIRR